MSGETNLTQLITTMDPVLDDQEYVFCSLTNFSPSLLEALEPIGTFKEKEGLTLILLKSKATEHKIDFTNTFSCITLNVHSSLQAVGLTAAVSTQLSKYNISANVIAGFYHDHIFVASDDGQQALFALKELVHT